MNASEDVSSWSDEGDTATVAPPVYPFARGEQVLANLSVDEQVLAKTDQSLNALGVVAANVISTLSSNRAETSLATQAAPATSAAVSVACPPRPRKERARRNAGGWRPSPRLAWSEVKEIDECVHRLKRAGVAPTHCITIMPSATITADSKRKRACVGTVAHIGEALTRHGTSHVGLTVFENRSNADLHAHHLIHVPGCELGTVERFHNPPAVCVQPIHDLPGEVRYLTKQRQRLPPAYEREIDRPWQRCLSVPGKRWTMTKAAQALLANSPSIPKVAAAAIRHANR